MYCMVLIYTYTNYLRLLRHCRYSVEYAVHSIQTNIRAISQKLGMNGFMLLSLSSVQLKGPIDEDLLIPYAKTVIDEPLSSPMN